MFGGKAARSYVARRDEVALRFCSEWFCSEWKRATEGKCELQMQAGATQVGSHVLQMQQTVNRDLE